MYGIEIKSKTSLLDWRQIFEHWHTEIQKNFDLAEGLDSPFVHGEHGNTHILGVSAALAGHGTIREVIGKRGTNSARLDLCLVSKSHLDLVEAKWAEFDGSDHKKYNQLETHLRSALFDAGAYENPHPLFSKQSKSKRRIGIVFIVPHFLPGNFDAKNLDNILEHIRKTISPDAIAWAFPGIKKPIPYWGRSYPGVITYASVLESEKHELLR